MKYFVSSTIIIILVFLASLTLADIPKLINYQGMLTNDSGDPLTGTYDITFKIYNASSGGDKKWEETQTDVAVTNGLFNVILGGATVGGIDLDFSEEYWLDITVEGESMSERLRFTSVGYAYRARLADTASVAISVPSAGGWTDDGAVVRLATSNDSVGIGTTNPSAKLDVRGTVNVGVEGTGHDVNVHGDSIASRMFWDKSKMAFRAGRAPGHQWDEDSLGLFSFAACNKTIASGLASAALGSKTRATGSASTVMGFLSEASGVAATAMGGGAIAAGTYSTAIGEATTANGWASTAIGQCLVADATGAIALGCGVYGQSDLINNIPHSLMVGFKRTTPTLFVDSLNVGIGTTAPSARLHVKNPTGDNSVKLSSATACTSSIKLFESDDYGFELAYAGNEDKLHLWSRKFSGNEGIRMTWLKDGKVGIGTTDPERNLHIAGSGYAEIELEKTNVPTNKWHISVYDQALYFTETDVGTRMTLENGGNVGIGTTDPNYKLDINGDINVTGSYNVKKGGANYNHPDYVFKPDYQLMPLNELKKYVIENKTLPNVISAEDVKENNGFKMDELLIQMLEKIEEQTLYIFQLEERIDDLEKEIEERK